MSIKGIAPRRYWLAVALSATSAAATLCLAPLVGPTRIDVARAIAGQSPDHLAAAYAHRVMMLQRGHVVADGPPEQALRSDRLRSVFDVPAELLRAPDGRHWIRYVD